MAAPATIVAVREPSAWSDAAYARAVDISPIACGAAQPWGCHPAPGEFMSLWNVMRFYAHHFLALMEALAKMDGIARQLCDLHKRASAGLGFDPLKADQAQNQDESSEQLQTAFRTIVPAQFALWRDLLNLVETHCRQLKLGSALAQVRRMRQQFADDANLPADLEASFRALSDRIEDQIRARYFMFIPRERAKYLQAKAPFGKLVKGRFPRVSEDVEEAGKCLGLERYTSAVFHLMRVLEWSVHRLAKRLGVTVNVQQPWGAILVPIDAAISALPGGPAATPKANARKAAFSQAAAYLRHVKDAWRNNTMHPKRTYTEEEARAIFGGVRTFMQCVVKLR